MRISRLELKAFGPFTDKWLDFATDVPGLHIVYGPNEAGKSSCLRAVKALLFGIPERTADNFLHPYDQLLVGGRLEAEDGRGISFFRRKKRKADLFDSEDNPLDPISVAPLLQGLEPAVFQSLYGIDHEDLVRGGEEILSQKGDVGQAIFAAGAGLTSLRAVMEELEAEADGLYRPRSSTRPVNEAVAGYREIRSQMKQAMVSGRAWQDHEKALREAEQALERVSASRADKDRERRRLERLRQALPHLSLRKGIREELRLLGKVKVLPEDFEERRRKLDREKNDAHLRLQAALSGLQEVEKRKKKISLQKELLNRSTEIDEVHQRLGQYRKASSDRPRLEGMRIGLKQDAAELLKQIRPDFSLHKVEALKPLLSKKKAVQGLSNRCQILTSTIEQVEKKCRKLKRALQKAQDDLSLLSPGKDPSGLLGAVRRAQRAGDVDADLARLQNRSDDIAQECRTALDRLGLWHGPLEEIVRLPVPMVETLSRFEQEMDSLMTRKQAAQTEGEDLKADAQRLSSELLEVRGSGRVPTEEELFSLRARRDQGWKLLRRRWLEKEDVSEAVLEFTPDAPLPEAYEKLVHMSDQAADRLRREADRVHKNASLESSIEAINTRLKDLEEEHKRLDSQLTDAEGRWRGLWAPSHMAPLPPREMRRWLSEFDKLRLQMGELEREAAELAEKEELRRDSLNDLIREMRELGDSTEFPETKIAPVLVRAEAFTDRIQRDNARMERLKNEIAELGETLRDAEEEKEREGQHLEEWKKDWEKALAPWGLQPDVSSQEAEEFIEILSVCFERVKKAEELETRINGIDRDNLAFEGDVERLVGRVDPTLKGKDVYQAVSALQSRLNGARRDEAVFQKYVEEGDALEKEIVLARAALENSKARMAELLEVAGCQDEGMLDYAQRCSNEYLRLKDKLAQAESTLAEIGGGVSIEELEEQTRKVDPDSIPGLVAALSREIDHVLDPEIRRVSEIMGREKNELARMDGGSRAADLAGSSQQALAKIRRLTDRYIRVKLASGILQDTIERYRAEHQDPVLEIASRYFRTLTLGSFTGLRTDVDDRGNAVLIGVRPQGTWVGVEGMSSGTRDQLYLCLRLASLEWRLELSGPMPLIADDVMINFDDERSRATLSALAELGEKNQVILFTHHARIVEAAGTLDADGRVFIHEL